jgi:hypothetical protein
MERRGSAVGTGVAMKVAIAATSITVGAIAGVVAVSAVLVWTVTQRL